MHHALLWFIKPLIIIFLAELQERPMLYFILSIISSIGNQATKRLLESTRLPP